MTSALRLTGAHGPEHCAWCGSVPDEPTFVDGSLSCSACAAETVFGGLLSRFNPTKRRIPPAGLAPEERFGPLFETARTLLRVDMGEEDRVFPTLAFAAEVGEGFLDLAAAKERLVAAREKDDEWQREVEKFARACPAYRPVGMVDGTPILERVRVSVEIRNYLHPHIVLPKVVAVTVYPHRRLTKPEHVAKLYDETLTANGLSYSTRPSGSLRYEFRGNCMHMELEHERGSEFVELLGTNFEPKFPSPERVREYYKMLVGTPGGFGFARYLVPRSRGRSWSADTLVPAWVACYLRRYGKVQSRKEVHNLLNEYVLCDIWRTLPTEGYSSSVVNQLWRDVKKIEYIVVIGTHGGFSGGPYI